MRESTKTFKTTVYSIDKNSNFIKQETLAITKHRMKKSYLILSKNDFGLKTRVNAGIFNRKTNFIVSEENSLIFYNQEKGLHNKKISEIEKNDFILYVPPYSYFNLNDEIITHVKFKNQKIKLDFDLGVEVGKLFTKQTFPTKDEFLNYIIDFKKTKIGIKTSVKKEFLANTNIEFLLGILYGAHGAFDFFDKKLILKNMNVYSIINILNTLGASYSVRNLIHNNEKYFYVRFKIPVQFNQYISQDISQDIYEKINLMFRKDYLFTENQKLELTDEIVFENLNDFEKAVNSGNIILIPVKDLKFIEAGEQIGYDFVTEGRDSGTNFMYAGLPFMKNSDGDILAVAAIHTPEAARDADKKFGIKVKENHLSFLTSKPRSWITNDAVLGLYEFTK